LLWSARSRWKLRAKSDISISIPASELIPSAVSGPRRVPPAGLVLPVGVARHGNVSDLYIRFDIHGASFAIV
jgi:hypothetical protein